MGKLGSLKFILVGVVIVLILGFLIYTSIQENMVYYFTPHEVVTQQGTLTERAIRVGGRVVPKSVQKDSAQLVLRFRLRDEQASLPIVYRGAVPDTFRPEGDGIVEGKLGKDGVFYAQTLLAKCPSKYERKT